MSDDLSDLVGENLPFGTSVYRTLRATGVLPAVIVVDRDVGDWSDQRYTIDGGEFGLRVGYQEEAWKLAEALCAHLPQGLIDHLLVDLLRRRASLLSGPLPVSDAAGV
jgi:hypothetical protein